MPVEQVVKEGSFMMSFFNENKEPKTLTYTPGSCWGVLRSKNIFSDAFSTRKDVVEAKMKEYQFSLFWYGFVNKAEHINKLSNINKDHVDLSIFAKMISTICKVYFVYMNQETKIISYSKELNLNDSLVGIGVEMKELNDNPYRRYVIFSLIRIGFIYIAGHGIYLEYVKESVSIKTEHPKWQSIKCIQLAQMYVPLKNISNKVLIEEKYITESTYYSLGSIGNSNLPAWNISNGFNINELYDIETYRKMEDYNNPSNGYVEINNTRDKMFTKNIVHLNPSYYREVDKEARTKLLEIVSTILKKDYLTAKKLLEIKS